MCGIIGFVGRKNSTEILYEGLMRLEYRGYDSVGIAVMDDKNIKCVKASGKVSAIEKDIKNLFGNIGIGHTRWATHGAPSAINAHPHCAGKICVVHNGIIENYAQLKNELIAEGRHFLSQTDSEVIPHLIDKYYNGDLLFAVTKAVKRLKGSYALCVICKDVRALIAVKMGSSVVVGRGDDGNFVCSDACALAGFANDICVLCDGDIAELTESSIGFFNVSGERFTKKFVKNTATAADIDLCDFPHYMIKEIYEIPTAVKNTINAVEAVAQNKNLVNALKSAERIIAVGCGTAYHACLIAARWFESICSVLSSAEIASEFRYKKMVIKPNTLVIAVSQSGETADTVEAATIAKSLGAKVIAVTNVEHSAVCQVADFVVPVRAGSEICVAATKSYCGQLAALYCLAQIIKTGAHMCELSLAQPLKEMPKLCEETIKNLHLDEISLLAAKSKGIYFIGRGIDGDVAAEGSLKMKEVSLKPGEGYPAGELKHGTLALIDENTLSVAIVCDKDLAEKSISAIEQITSRGGKVAAVCSLQSYFLRLEKIANFVIKIPKCDRDLSPIISVIPLFMLAYKTSLACGCNPDRPRNLAKSVTVE